MARTDRREYRRSKLFLLRDDTEERPQEGMEGFFEKVVSVPDPGDALLHGAAVGNRERDFACLCGLLRRKEQTYLNAYTDSP